MADDTFDARELAADIDEVVAAQTNLVGHLRSLDPVDPATPSRLPDWTVGHVLTHLARQADSVMSMLAGLPQYPEGRAGRAADIEAGATRSWEVLVDDVADTATTVADALSTETNWTGTVESIAGDRPRSMLPFLRQREVEVHRTDIGLGYEFADLPVRYLRKELRMMEMLWRARKPMGMTTLPAAALTLDPSTRLAWMMGRVEIDGLAPAAIF